MMFESWAAFTAASAILLIIPGPTVLLVVSYALGQGWRTALPMAVGVALGDFTAMTLSMLGLGALLAASATLFTILKWVGAAYLVWLGIKLWRAGGALEANPRTDAVSAIKCWAMPGW
jgi:threonine/homoserine/homoserine lactone efflux protein